MPTLRLEGGEERGREEADGRLQPLEVWGQGGGVRQRRNEIGANCAIRSSKSSFRFLISLLACLLACLFTAVSISRLTERGRGGQVEGREGGAALESRHQHAAVRTPSSALREKEEKGKRGKGGGGIERGKGMQMAAHRQRSVGRQSWLRSPGGGFPYVETPVPATKIR